ncbi:MAG: hypothetical protein PHU46_08080 [Rhodocyclaceae bacterium]|nr:hypothetical protein [Rhodocyclaceae bacterium]
MKFPHLSIGARFEYEGKVFVKTGPMTASSEQGGQCLIPRYAVLKPLDGAQPETKPSTSRQLDEAKVLAAFETFYATCARLADEPSRVELAEARQKFLVRLRAKG